MKGPEYSTFIKPGENSKPKESTIYILENPKEREENKILKDRFSDIIKKALQNIRDRDTKIAMGNVNKKLRNESYETRTLREFESKLQNDVLKLIFQGKNPHHAEFNSSMKETLYSELRTAYHKIRPGDSDRYAEGLVRGINACFLYAKERYVQENINNKDIVIGINNYLDAKYEVDLIEILKDHVNLTQIKSSEMDSDKIMSIHERHQECYDSIHKNIFEHMHILLDNHTHNIDLESFENEKFKNHLENIHDFLGWVKEFYDERLDESDNKEDTKINQDFLEECNDLSEKNEEFIFTYADMALVFQKGDILHNIFMMGGGNYQSIFNKLSSAQEILPKRLLVKIKNEGILSLLYDNDNVEKIFSYDVLDQEEKEKLTKYILLMRALDNWSFEYLQEMSNKEKKNTYQKYESLLNLDPNRFVDSLADVQSVVVHGNKEHIQKIS